MSNTHDAVILLQLEKELHMRMSYLRLPTDRICTRIDVIRALFEQDRDRIHRDGNVWRFILKWGDGANRASIFESLQVGVRIAEHAREGRTADELTAWLNDFLPDANQVVFDYRPTSSTPVTIAGTMISDGQLLRYSAQQPPQLGEPIVTPSDTYTREQILLVVVCVHRAMFGGVSSSSIAHVLNITGPGVKCAAVTVYDSIEFGRALKNMLRGTSDMDLPGELTALVAKSGMGANHWNEIVFDRRWLVAQNKSELAEELSYVRQKRTYLAMLDTTATNVATIKRLDAREVELINALAVSFASDK